MLDSKMLDRFSHVVESIYAAALEPTQWPTAVAQIAHLHGSDKALLFTPVTSPEAGGIAFPHGISETAMLDWGGRFIQHDLWTQAGTRRGLVSGEAVLDTDLVNDAEFETSTFFREFLVHHDIRRLCSGWVFDQSSVAMPMIGCSVYGRLAAQPFNDINRQLHHLTLNHLSKSLGTMFRLRDTELQLASTLAALDRLSGAIVLLGSRGQVVFANAAAQSLLAHADGLSLRASAVAGEGLGWLQSSRADEQVQLKHEIATAMASDPMQTGHFSSALQIQRPSGRRALALQIAPLSERSGLAHADRHAHAIVFLTDPDANVQLDPALLETLYRITPAEARLAGELLVGSALPDIAARLNLGASTLRSHLKSLFVKTATHRQADLVKLLMSLSTRR